jgi:hypothetical protein
VHLVGFLFIVVFADARNHEPEITVCYHWTGQPVNAGLYICCKNITELANSLYENCYAFNVNLVLLTLTTLFGTVLFPVNKSVNFCVVFNS